MDLNWASVVASAWALAIANGALAGKSAVVGRARPAISTARARRLVKAVIMASSSLFVSMLTSRLTRAAAPISREKGRSRSIAAAAIVKIGRRREISGLVRSPPRKNPGGNRRLRPFRRRPEWTGFATFKLRRDGRA